MSFTSFHFVFFFVFVFFAYWTIPHRYRYLLLLAASYYFYGWAGWFCLGALLLLTAAHYVLGIFIERSRGRMKVCGMSLGVASVLLMLYALKYHTVINQWIGDLIHLSPGRSDLFNFQWIMPIGVSFYALQSLGYLIDVYRRTIKAEYHLGHYALYVAFFPQLVAGPIERSTELLPQVASTKKFDHAQCVTGLRLMLWGFFKKLVVADRISVAVDLVYQNPGVYNGATLLVATYLFAFQILLDFSAYTDIARGGARMLGFRLRRNFRQPYCATSVTDFWRRWHMSLSTWFRDYVYIPMGGNRVGKIAFARNLLVVFALSGLWHGAGFNFLFWGILHGLLMLVERVFVARRSGLPAPAEPPGGGRAPAFLKRLLTFHVIVLTWVFFRCPDVVQGFHMIGAMFTQFGDGSVQLPGSRLLDRCWMAGGITLVMAVDLAREMRPAGNRLDRMPGWLRWGAYTLGAWSILLFGWREPYTFIYFVF